MITEKDLEKATYGIELEWTDWPFLEIEIPEHLGYVDYKETAVNNQDGTAWDWTKTWNPTGGEICSTPSSSPEDLAKKVWDLAALVKPKLSHRSFTHIHVAIPGMKDDIEKLKWLVRYTLDNRDFIRYEAFPVPRPKRADYPDEEDFKWAKKFHRVATNWMHATVQKPRIEEMMSAETFDEFYNAHFSTHPKDSSRRLKHLAPRPYVNTRSLLKHGTFEFRHFWGTTSGEDVQQMAEYATKFLYHALFTGVPMEDWYPAEKQVNEWEWPEMPLFLPENEKRFQETFTPLPVNIGDNFDDEQIKRVVEKARQKVNK